MQIWTNHFTLLGFSLICKAERLDCRAPAHLPAKNRQILSSTCGVQCLVYWQGLKVRFGPRSVGREGKAHFDSVPKWKVTRLLYNESNSLVLVFWGGEVNTESWLAFPIPVVSLLYCKHRASGSFPSKWNVPGFGIPLFMAHSSAVDAVNYFPCALPWTFTISCSAFMTARLIKWRFLNIVLHKR